MKYFLLAGEASGDRQAALLSMAILKHDPAAQLNGWGGDEMIKQGVRITKHFRDLAFMGFVEVVRHLPAIIKNFKTCKKEILALKPDAVILVDYPGFNLKMAAWASKHNFPVYYYISPQLWAWHTSRVFQIKKYIRRVYAILPFEKDFYKQYGIDCLYIGHPLAIELQGHDLANIEKVKGQIALLPGSRKHEINLILPELIRLARMLPERKFVVAAVSHIPLNIYRFIIGEEPNVRIESGNLKNVVVESEAAVVTSGTATLETALLGTPQIVVYKGNPFSYQLAKRLVKVPYISLVNLIMNKKLVPELIQAECTAERMHKKLMKILQPEVYADIKHGYRLLTNKLTAGGGPDAAAEDILADLKIFKQQANGQI